MESGSSCSEDPESLSRALRQNNSRPTPRTPKRPLPPDAAYTPAKRSVDSARRVRQRSLDLIKLHAGEYAASIAPDWVVKVVANIDRYHWEMLETHLNAATQLRQDIETVKEQAKAPLRQAQARIAQLEEELNRESQIRAESEQRLHDSSAMQEEKMKAVEQAELVAAAAIADVADLSSQLENERHVGRQLKTQRLVRTHDLRQNLLKVKGDLRGERRNRKASEKNLYCLEQVHKATCDEKEDMEHKLTEVQDNWSRQRTYLISQVNALRTSMAAAGASPLRCQTCGSLVPLTESTIMNSQHRDPENCRGLSATRQAPFLS
ncbi:hypothetical protein CYMTET_36580 [Cymbomonas tetramitiformis]|uniref:Uncharacterized protein n=1 Tax=Cymbomonas tetramitiformis TaxID=36881 RepID=A0AAE0F7T5_9CHLO|nr:hypothetical protein CYMTET_36580 [Cymbomonas tetramitiformis]